MAKIEDVLKNNERLLHVLNDVGIKSIQTAIDYLQIFVMYESLDYVKSKVERKERVADRFGVSKRTVDTAISVCQQESPIIIR